MNQQQDNLALIKHIEQKWLEASSELQSKRKEYAQANQVNQEIRRDIQSLQKIIINRLKESWQKQSTKINKIEQIQRMFDSELDNYHRQQTNTSKSTLLMNQEKISLLEMSLQNPLKFDSLNAKAERMRMQFQNKGSVLKDDIKKVKLRVSLCEMEYKQLVNVGKRKSD